MWCVLRNIDGDLVSGSICLHIFQFQPLYANTVLCCPLTVGFSAPEKEHLLTNPVIHFQFPDMMVSSTPPLKFIPNQLLVPISTDSSLLSQSTPLPSSFEVPPMPHFFSLTEEFLPLRINQDDIVSDLLIEIFESPLKTNEKPIAALSLSLCDCINIFAKEYQLPILSKKYHQGHNFPSFICHDSQSSRILSVRPFTQD